MGTNTSGVGLWEIVNEAISERYSGEMGRLLSK
jgi:hypothetical protein